MDYLQTILPDLQNLGFWGYWVMVCIFAFESASLLGLVVPGTPLVLLAGFLAAERTFDLVDLIWFVTLGAIIGDNLSFYFGTRSTGLFKPTNKFFKPSHLQKGEKFFAAHGTKSVFLARFIGPLRSIVPFIAGLTKMKYKDFFWWNILSAFTWAITTLLVGYFFGAVLLSF